MLPVSRYSGTSQPTGRSNLLKLTSSIKCNERHIDQVRGHAEGSARPCCGNHATLRTPTKGVVVACQQRARPNSRRSTFKPAKRNARSKQRGHLAKGLAQRVLEERVYKGCVQRSSENASRRNLGSYLIQILAEMACPAYTRRYPRNSPTITERVGAHHSVTIGGCHMHPSEEIRAQGSWRTPNQPQLPPPTRTRTRTHTHTHTHTHAHTHTYTNAHARTHAHTYAPYCYCIIVRLMTWASGKR